MAWLFKGQCARGYGLTEEQAGSRISRGNHIYKRGEKL